MHLQHQPSGAVLILGHAHMLPFSCQILQHGWVFSLADCELLGDTCRGLFLAPHLKSSSRGSRGTARGLTLSLCSLGDLLWWWSLPGDGGCTVLLAYFYSTGGAGRMPRSRRRSLEKEDQERPPGAREPQGFPKASFRCLPSVWARGDLLCLHTPAPLLVPGGAQDRWKTKRRD